MALGQIPAFLIWLLIAAQCHESSQLTPLKIQTADFSKTYFIETFFRASWDQALRFCKFHGMELASINYLRESNSLTNELTKNNLNHHSAIWVGGTNYYFPYSWVWISNNRPLTFTNWVPNEPNNYGGNENCISLSGPDNFKWNDVNCLKEFYFICEKTTN